MFSADCLLSVKYQPIVDEKLLQVYNFYSCFCCENSVSFEQKPGFNSKPIF